MFNSPRAIRQIGRGRCHMNAARVL